VSEFFADELAAVLNCSRTAATTLADSAALLTERLPATWAALADGQLDWPRARALAAELVDPARDVAPHVLAEVEAAVLPRARERSIPALQAAVRKELLRRDAAAADRRRKQAERAADVTVRAARDGMAHLSIFAPQPFVAAICNALDDHARAAKEDGDGRTLGQLRVGVLGDLVLRPWDDTRPPVTAHLTVLAPLNTLAVGAAGHDVRAAGHRGPHLTDGDRPARARAPLRQSLVPMAVDAQNRPRSTGSRSLPPTCARCSSSWTRCAPAGSRRRREAPCTSG
jgi:hypothetical protein